MLHIVWDFHACVSLRKSQDHYEKWNMIMAIKYIFSVKTMSLTMIFKKLFILN